MSANNQQQQANPSAAVVASAASSEYLKRTCLICGCHTNQTINIYEPRSGPNIVQLIQAKFKFQPLNEDKFLCFSCNNWLINWHSLQAVNSNEAEGQSQSQSQSQSPSHMGNSVLQQQEQRTKLRPVAMVRPQVRVQPISHSQPVPQLQPQAPVNPTPAPITYAKRRSSRRSASVSRMSRILRQSCLESLRRSPKKRMFLCIKPLNAKRSGSAICRVECVAPRRKPMEATATTGTTGTTSTTNQRCPQPSVDGKVVAMFRRLGTTLSREQPPAESTTSKSTSSSSSSTASLKLPQIMSPLKEKPRWTRALDEDEILLEFDSAISEVLPTNKVRRCLEYQVTHGDDKENEEVEMEMEEEEEGEKQEKKVWDQVELKVVQEAEAPLEPQSHRKTGGSHRDSHQAAVQLAGLRLPMGLSISLV
ncbi:protein phyllopod [Drosophila ficusphila]|uniref:protein phyllopod n=1 Tax=Drosophila ficusphila TaxID=30025 RepID=UPI0007E8B207|nr:protein phyllopod [Drosophila ficusphila]